MFLLLHRGSGPGRDQHHSALQVAHVEQRWQPQRAEVTAEAEEKQQNMDTEM